MRDKESERGESESERKKMKDGLMLTQRLVTWSEHQSKLNGQTFRLLDASVSWEEAHSW